MASQHETAIFIPLGGVVEEAIPEMRKKFFVLIL
jgi:hypothetical protein